MITRKALLISVVSALLVTVAVVSFASTALAQASTVTRWEYMSMSYSQYLVIGTGFAFGVDEQRYELITAPEPYGTEFNELLLSGCEFTGNDFDVESELCMAGNFIGLEYALNVVGYDGWELISLVNNSTEFSYSVEMIFKRPKQS